MKTSNTAACRLLVPLLALLALVPPSSTAATQPRITGIDVSGNQLVIAAEAPPGVRRLVLEGSERGDLRGWRPRAVQNVDAAGPVAFNLPRSLADSLRIEMFRVRADTNVPLPAAFFTGKTRFDGDPAPAGSPLLFRGADGGEWLVDNALPAVPTANQPTPGATGAPERAVAESDIWRLHGDRLYFFNSQRGLQIIDVANPDDPALLGTFALPASGEQMYLLGDRHVVLLARSHPCSTDWGQNARSAAIVIDVSDVVPREIARIPLDGRILESRLVGTALYIATDNWLPKTDRPEDEGVWINGTQVTGIDLAQPAQPVSRNPVWLAGSGNVVTATERFLLIGVQSSQSGRAWDSNLHVLDITDPAGTIREFTTVPLDGRLQDKFKVNVSGDILTAITAGPSQADGSGTWRSVLTTYRLSETTGSAPTATRLGTVEVGHGEQLYATRFDGARAYLVTFRQIDPLWIIDLSQPESPRILGELEIPGWSTYIHPLGDRLLTVGIDDTRGARAAVQLFDVADPAHPRLLSKVPLGSEWSWTEANSDEKALGVFPDAGLVLVPFSSSGASQQIVGVQVVDLGRDTLTARGRIDSPNVVPRRTALTSDRVLAVSSRDLLAVNLADRDDPKIQSRLELSYPVDRVIPIGEWLVEFSGPRIQTRSGATPTLTRTRLDLADLPVLGAVLEGDRIHILQGSAALTIWTEDQWVTNKPAAVKLTVLDASALPNLTVLGTTSHDVDTSASGDFEALWPRPGLVVWAPVTVHAPWIYRGSPWVIDFIQIPPLIPGPAPTSVSAPASPAVSVVDLNVRFDAAVPPILIGGWDGMGLWGGWWNFTPPTLFAFDVSNPSEPRLTSVVSAPKDAFSPSRAFTANGLVYYSHDTQETRITATNSYTYTVREPVVTTRVTEVTNLVQIPYEVLVTNIHAKQFSVPAWQIVAPELDSIHAGTLHALGRTPAGAVLGWGDNRAGQLGSLILINSDTPIEVPFPGTASAIAAAKWFSLALLSDGTVWMAGTPAGPDGPPLPSAPDDLLSSSPIRQISGLPSDLVEVAAGYHHALARSTDGQLFAWGQNDRGQVGFGDDLDHASPVALTLAQPIATMAGGGLHSLALTRDGSVLGWGDNQRLQIGAALPDRVLTPQPIPGLTDILAIAAGDFHSLALDHSNTVWAWGETLENIPGGGTAPQPVPGLPPVRAIAAGRYHSLAVDLEGGVWSWGQHAGEPFRVQPLEPIQSVSARGGYAIARAAGGRTYLWQLDEYPTPAAGNRFPLTLVGPPRTVVEPEIRHRLETNIVTREVRETQWVETTVTNSYPVYEYSTHHHLNVVDFAVDPAVPVIRPPIPLPGSLRGLAHEGALLFTLGTRSDRTDPNGPARSWLEAAAYDGTAAHLVRSLEVANTTQGSSALVEVTPNGTVWLAQSDGAKSHSLAIMALDASGNFQKLASLPLESPASDLGRVDNTLAVSFGSSLQLFHATTEPAPGLSPRGLPFDLGCLLPSIHRLAGNADDGFWAPLGDFGSAPLP